MNDPLSNADTDFRTELQQVINRHSREGGSDTPDLILAEYLVACLDAFDAATFARSTWYGPIAPSA